MRKAVFRRTCAASIPSFRVSSQFLRPAVGSDPLRSTSRATRLEDKTLVSKALLCTATTGRDNYPSSSVGCLTPVELINVVKHSYCLILNRPEFIQDGNRRATNGWGAIAVRREDSPIEGGRISVMAATIINKLSARVGFIGLGLMGSRLARRLHSDGWKVQAWNRSPQPAEEIEKEGIAIAASIGELVSGSGVILSSLANDAAVQSVYLGNGGVFSAVKPGTVILEMSTISPELSRSLHEKARARGVQLLDVAISGSTPAVEAGTITLLAGGDNETFELCVPIFEAISRQWFRIGPGSSGVQMKLVVNLLLGLDMQAIAEAVSLGEHLQIDRNVLLDVLSKTAVVAPAMAGKFRKIKDGDYSPEFPLRLMSKDMDLVMDAAKKVGANLPAASVAQSVLASNVPASGNLDLAAITPFVLDRETRSEAADHTIR